jgi:hypothetical protein|tara:strand:+ start:217 stop:648 length:432 start_codon:yes stop_codon:yes gene_type:complete
MPRKKPTELKNAAPAEAPAPKISAPAPVSTPVVAAPAPAAQNTGYHPADINGDGHVDSEEKQMELEFRRKSLEDQDAMRDAQRSMTWFALFGLLLYPFAVVVTSLLGLSEATKTLGSMAPTYFVAVAGIVAAFFGAQAYSKKK